MLQRGAVQMYCEVGQGAGACKISGIADIFDAISFDSGIFLGGVPLLRRVRQRR
jgi:hypothetical protein